MKKAKSTLERFLKAWVEGNYPKMYKYAQVTWKSTATKRVLDNRFRPVKIEEYSIGECRKVSEAMYEFKVQVKVNGRWKDPDMVNVICEEAPYKPSETGIWGVNPISALKTIKPD